MTIQRSATGFLIKRCSSSVLTKVKGTKSRTLFMFSLFAALRWWRLIFSPQTLWRLISKDRMWSCRASASRPPSSRRWRATRCPWMLWSAPCDRPESTGSSPWPPGTLNVRTAHKPIFTTHAWPSQTQLIYSQCQIFSWSFNKEKFLPCQLIFTVIKMKSTIRPHAGWNLRD